MKSVLKKEHSLICVTILSAMFGLTGCGGSDGESKFDITRPIESTLEITLDGIFTDSDEMTVEFDGEKAVIIDYGNSIFGTNPSVIPLGKPLIQDIRCNTQSCTGLLGVPSVSNGVLDRVRWEAVTLTPAKDDQITLENVSLGKYTLSPKKEDHTKDDEQVGVTLKYDATCDEWWAALSNNGAGRTWRATWMREHSVFGRGYTGFGDNNPGDLTFKFSNQKRYQFNWRLPNSEYNTADNEEGDVHGWDRWDSVWPIPEGKVGICRFVTGSAVIFPYSLSSGELVLVDIDTYEPILKLKAE